MSSEKWIAVTAGVGSVEFERAAKRVKADLEKSGVVDKVVAVFTDDLLTVCPQTSTVYAELINNDNRGFGYMCWKAEIVNRAFEGFWGDFDGVIWVDAGCEVSINPVSRIRLWNFQKFAKRNGVACFTLDTLEIEYSKRDLFEFFPEIEPTKAGKQIQTTWFLLHGKLGLEISKQWLETVLAGTNLLDLKPSRLLEFPGFIENRYDQSTFSLVCKKNNIRVMNYVPTAGRNSIAAVINGFFHPIWTSRNRFGTTIKKKIHRIFEYREC